tara:strand:- start:1977 stop:2210 length:234 start_codon:yes stop_codon:yes gene_type:complete
MSNNTLEKLVFEALGEIRGVNKTVNELAVTVGSLATKEHVSNIEKDVNRLYTMGKTIGKISVFIGACFGVLKGYHWK